MINPSTLHRRNTGPRLLAGAMALAALLLSAAAPASAQQYRKDRNMDAALYWLAYAHNRQGNPQAAEAPLARLLQNHPNSRWADDAKALRLEVFSKLGRPITAIDEADATVELKIVALRTL